MTSTITKSIRLSSKESAELAELSDKTLLSEAALMKKWIQEGMQAQKLELAIQSYMQRKVDLRAGAVMADMPFNRFVKEVQDRNIIVLDETGFPQRLTALGEMFEDTLLRAAAVELLHSPSGNQPS